MPRANRPCQRVRRGFATSEILVVIGTTCLLAILLIGLFGPSYRRLAGAESCLRNLHALGMAMPLYVDDNDAMYPLGNPGTRAAPPENGYVMCLYPYTVFYPNRELFTCPSDTAAPPGSNGAISYGYNQNLGANGLHGKSRSLAELTNTSRTILFFEVGGYGNFDVDVSDETFSPAGCGAIRGGGCALNPGPSRLGGYASGPMAGGNRFGLDPVWPAGRHDQGSNYAFADWHVKWLQGSSVAPGHDAPSPISPQTAKTAAGARVPGYGGTFSTM